MSYHVDMRCGSCAGPLEDDRNAVCHRCAPESKWFAEVAAAEEWSRRSSRNAIKALVAAVLWTIAGLLVLSALGCASLVDVKDPPPLYGPGGYAERMHVQRAPYAAPCRRR